MIIICIINKIYWIYTIFNIIYMETEYHKLVHGGNALFIIALIRIRNQMEQRGNKALRSIGRFFR